MQLEFRRPKAAKLAVERQGGPLSLGDARRNHEIISRRLSLRAQIASKKAPTLAD